MNYEEKELLILRILAGYQVFDGIKLFAPSPAEEYEALLVYNQALEHARKFCMTSEDILAELFSRDIWTEDYQKFVEDYEDTIGSLQKDLFVNCNNETQVKIIKAELAHVRAEYRKLSDIKNQYETYSAEGIANIAKFDKLIDLISRHKVQNSNRAIAYYLNNLICPLQIREISHTAPWGSKWSALKANGIIFPEGANVDKYKEYLLMWSKMYDAINENTECPPPFVIKDNDMLDGWLLTQQESTEKEQTKKTIELNTKSDRIRKAHEVFIKVNSLEEAKRVSKLNSTVGNMIIKKRLAALESGPKHYVEFKDVQKRAMLNGNQKGTVPKISR